MTRLPVNCVQLSCPGDQRAVWGDHLWLPAWSEVCQGAVEWLISGTGSQCRRRNMGLSCFLSQQKSVQFQFHSSLWFLVLSFLSLSSCAVEDTTDLRMCITNLRNTIEKSDAMLYSPSIDDIEENCENVSLKCYMLELEMVLDEEEVYDGNASCILAFKERLDSNSHTGGCPPCEAYSLQNITIFLDRLITLLEKLTARGNH